MCNAFYILKDKEISVNSRNINYCLVKEIIKKTTRCVSQQFFCIPLSIASVIEIHRKGKTVTLYSLCKIEIET